MKPETLESLFLLLLVTITIAVGWSIGTYVGNLQ
jgi:hypothetical protein